MSTKSSISHSPSHHLYEETFEGGYIYLEVQGCLVSVSTEGKGATTLRIPVSLWDEIMEGWISGRGEIKKEFLEEQEGTLFGETMDILTVRKVAK